MGVRLTGHCVCRNLRYSLDLDSAEDARTTLCHCRSCRTAFGTNYGLTAKVPVRSFKYDDGSKPKTFKQDNGVVREFCENCGAYICEYGVCDTESLFLHNRPRQGLVTLTSPVIIGGGGRQVSLCHVGDAGGAREDSAERRVLLQESSGLDA